MKEQLEQLKVKALTALQQAITPADLEELRVRYLGKKGEVTAVLKQMGKLSAEERPVIGQLANNVRAEIEEQLDIRKNEIHSAVMEQNLGFFETYFAKYKQCASVQGIFEIRCLQAELYATFDIEKKEKLKEELLATLDNLKYNAYLKESYRSKIQLL